MLTTISPLLSLILTISALIFALGGWYIKSNIVNKRLDEMKDEVKYINTTLSNTLTNVQLQQARTDEKVINMQSYMTDKLTKFDHLLEILASNMKRPSHDS